MQSIFGGFTQEEIARIRSGSKGHSRKRMTLYEALKEVAQRGRMAEAGEEASAGESAGEETAGAGQYWQRALEAATVPEDMEDVYKRQLLHKQGYIHEVKSAISEFMQYGISTQDMDKLITSAQKRGALAMKLKDLKTLYRGFQDYIRDHFITTEETLDVLRRSCLLYTS